MQDLHVFSPHEHRDLVEQSAVQIAGIPDVVWSLRVHMTFISVSFFSAQCNRSNASWIAERTAELLVKLQSFNSPSNVSTFVKTRESSLSLL